MAFIEAPNNFYLGRVFDPQENKMTDDVVYYDARDLTTHAVVVGMTGSGKTGLCISMLEEAMLDDIPAIIIDPKGDICNLALTFPDFMPQDFAPWIHEEDALRANMRIEDYAANEAAKWREGLRNWGIVPDRLKWLKGVSKLSIYPPGSDAGLPISILASLRAPRTHWHGQEELIRERISGVVTALFTLAGLSFQPMQDAEHVLLSNILEVNWQQGRDLTLEDIILQIKQPPFERLGAFTLEQYISEKKRYQLAMTLNNIIAAPSFKSWLQGEPLDIQNLLYQPNGRPKVSIFYTAHLTDQERMFITTLILESLIAWMRTQRGTPSLRAILYIDEVFGYFPPHPRNPPTKEPIMRLLKQARAFGIGLVLATQNPGDLDYKGLSNAGTWFIGRLSSENDRRRVMAGLQELATAGDGLDLRSVERLIADIRPRVFLMRNVHNAAGAVLIHSRWAMSYLAGPMTRQQISFLMQAQRQQLFAQQAASAPGWTSPYQAFNPNQPPAPPAFGGTMPPPPAFGGTMPPPPAFGGTMPPPPPAFGGNMPPPPPAFGAQTAPTTPLGDTGAVQSQRMAGDFLQTQPAIPSAITQYFLPTTLSAQQAFARAGVMGGGGQVLLAYVPVLLAQVIVRYQQKTAQIYLAKEFAYHVEDLPPHGLIQWERYQAHPVDGRQVSSQPFGQAIFKQVPPALLDAKRLNALRSELVDMIAMTAKLVIGYHPQFKIFADPNRDPSEFYAQVEQMAREKRDEELDKINKKYGAAMDKLEDQFKRKERELAAEKLEIRDRQREQLYTTGEALLSIFRGRTNYTLSRMSRTTRMKRQTEAELQESREVLQDLQQQMIALEDEYERVIQELNERWARIATAVEEFTITPFKKDISVAMFGVGWVPHYYTLAGNQPILAKAYE